MNADIERRALRLAVQLADDVTAADASRPVRPWSWGPALLGFALSLLERRLDEPRYRDWLRCYVDHHLAREPRIVSSDTVAPGLITSYLGDVVEGLEGARYRVLTERCLDYLASAPRLVDDAVNHLGTARWNWLYPRSVWVDSLMMFSVFPARYGVSHGRPDLVALAARQPGSYARLLTDPSTGLWSHSWWAALPGRPAGRYPRRVAWARGNGWVVASLPLIAAAARRAGMSGPALEQIAALHRDLSVALVRYQRPDGAFPTVLAPPRLPTYRELSATALVAAGWFQGMREGLIDRSYAVPARRALGACVAALRRGPDGWELPHISGPTVPLPVAPTFGYRYVPRHSNEPYGVAAFILAALAATDAGIPEA